MNRFRLLRYERGLTLKDLSDSAGIAVGTLRRLEAGSTPSGPVAKKLADFYELTVGELLGLPSEEAA